MLDLPNTARLTLWSGADFECMFPAAQDRRMIESALALAASSHAGQARKYTGAPYIEHPMEVARIVASVCPQADMAAAALLHDVLEDTDTEKAEVAEAVGTPVLALVEQLTDVSVPSDGNRAVRKGLDRAHLAQACPEAKLVKLADLISNSASIVEHDPGFAKVYMGEKRLLLEEALTNDAARGDLRGVHAATEELRQRAWALVLDFERGAGPLPGESLDAEDGPQP